MSDIEKDKLELAELEKQLRVAVDNANFWFKDSEKARVRYDKIRSFRDKISEKIKEINKRINPHIKYFDIGEYVHVKPAAFTNMPEFDGRIVEAIEYLDCYRVMADFHSLIEVPREHIYHIKTETKYY